MKLKPEMSLEKQTCNVGTTCLLFKFLKVCCLRLKSSVDADASQSDSI